MRSRGAFKQMIRDTRITAVDDYGGARIGIRAFVLAINDSIEIAQEICEAISDRVAGYQVSAPFGIVDLALQVLA